MPPKPPVAQSRQACHLRIMTSHLTSPDGTPASRFAFGTMQFGGRADAAASRAMYDAALDAGITHFDTAFVYNEGRSEELLGSFLGTKRDRLLIATKAAYSGGGSRANIQSSFEVKSWHGLITQAIQAIGLSHTSTGKPECAFFSFSYNGDCITFQVFACCNPKFCQIFFIEGINLIV